MSVSPNWKEELAQNGYTVIKGAVPVERANEYVDRGLTWLEGFDYTKVNLGKDPPTKPFKRDDPSTWTYAHLPDHSLGGLFTGYACSHEDWVWQARTEEGVIKPFEELWGTKELIVSYDAINISFPQGEGKRTDMPFIGPWPHIDQQPSPVGRPALEFELAQGLISLTKSGPDDGGLIVVKGTNNLQKEFFAATGGPKEAQDSGDRAFYRYNEEDMKWFYAQPGVEVIKVESEVGDLVMWDSRTIHWNCPPSADQTRVVVYVCCCPINLVEPETLKGKQETFKKARATTHWPQYNIVPVERHGFPKKNDILDPLDRDHTVDPPKLDERQLRLAGMLPY